MAFRFWRRIRLAPGVTLNLSKSAASLSFGPRGAKYTISPRGNRATAGVPGTGLFYTMRDPGAGRGQERGASAPMVRARDRLTLGFFQRLITPAAERAFVDGLKALNEGDDSEALVLLDRSASLADAAWLAGMLHLKSENFDQAERCLLDALERRHTLDSAVQQVRSQRDHQPADHSRNIGACAASRTGDTSGPDRGLPVAGTFGRGIDPSGSAARSGQVRQAQADASSSAFMPRIRGLRMSPNGSAFDVRFRRRSLADEDINRRDGT